MVEDVRLGSRVGVDFGNEVRPARVIEDRGNLGPGGERVWRVVFETAPGLEDDTFEIEMPVSWFVPAPPPPGPLHPRRRAARRKPAPA
jgi:hypothetical protein